MDQVSTTRDSFGWDLAIAGDRDRDGREDIFVGAPGDITGKVYLVSGRDGSILRTYASPHQHDSFGWYVTRVPDLDNDGLDDLAASAPWYTADGMARAGRMEIRSGRTGEVLVELVGDAPERWFGWHVEYAPDVGQRHERGLLISLIRSHENVLQGAGALELYTIDAIAEPRFLPWRVAEEIAAPTAPPREPGLYTPDFCQRQRVRVLRYVLQERDTPIRTRNGRRAFM